MPSRLAFVFPRLERCGPFYGVLATIKHLPRRNYRLYFVALSPPRHPDLKDVLRKFGCTYVQISQSHIRPFDLHLASSLRRFCQAEKIDIVHSTEPICDWICALATLTSSRNVITVTTLRGEDDRILSLTKGPLITALVHVVNRLAFRRFHQVIALSESTLQYALRLGVSGRRITLIKNAIDCSPFRNIDHAEARRHICNMYNIDRKKVLIGMVATFQPNKDHQAFLEVATRLQSRQDLLFLDIGQGPQLPLFRELARRRALTNVIYPGFIENPSTALAALDVHLFLSFTEGLPRALMESMAAQTAVVAWAASGVRELITHRVNGLLSPIGDLELIKSYLLELVSSPQYRLQLAQSARRYIMEYCDAVRMAAHHDELYRFLLSSRQISP